MHDKKKIQLNKSKFTSNRYLFFSFLSAIGVMLMIYHSLKVGFENLNGLTEEAFREFRNGGFCNAPRGEIYG